jgi:hypothetical protein
MTPGMPSGSDVPDDAGIGSRTESAIRKHGAMMWLLLVFGGGLVTLIVTGTLGASLVNESAELGPPRVIGEIDATPYLAFTAGDYAVGVVVGESTTEVLFGATERPLPPPE